jgi:hypothetical protein
MPSVIRGVYYEFSRSRVISRPGQPTETRDDVEIGRPVAREHAMRLAKAGKDVYTPARRDAYELARDAYNGLEPKEEAHKKGDALVFYAHFHPGGVHHREGGGAVYYGERGRQVE